MEKRKKLKPIIISAVILSIIGYLIYSGLRDTMTYYFTVSEVLAKTTATSNESIRVGGTVSPASVKWDPRELKLLFTIEDEKSSLAVDYKGVVPDSFKPGKEVIVEGIYNDEGKFSATTIMPKCASKYE